MAYVRPLPAPPKCVECYNRKKATHQVYNRYNEPVAAPKCEKHAEKLQRSLQEMETKHYPRRPT